MSLHRRAAKRDQSEKDIIAYLRKAGWSVLQISVEDGPDILCGKHGTDIKAEVKTGKRKLRPGQVKFQQEWKGSPVYVLRSIDDAIALNAVVNKLAR